MNMFSGIHQVDEHVKRLLNISKNPDDVDSQCHTIAKLYFEIKEYGVAKSYIERYIKAKSNSESGLLLKAEIHEKLKEYPQALYSYENLYNIFNKKIYVTKGCNCLLASEMGDQKAKFWIDTLEAEDPSSDLLIDLKIRYFGTLEASLKELNNLEIKMKNDGNNQVKRQYLAILERVQVTDNVLEKCISFIQNYSFLDDINLVKSCVKIFERIKIIEGQSKSIYSILLIALLKNRVKSSEFDCAKYLFKLYDLLRQDSVKVINSELKYQFLYHLVSYAHGLVTKTMTTDIASCLYKGYLYLQTSEKPSQTPELSANLFAWLNSQYKYRRSVISHMITNANDAIASKTCSKEECVDIITRIIWPTKNDNYDDLTKMFGDNKKIDSSKVIESDIECHKEQKMDFALIMWQLMGHLGALCTDDLNELDITPRGASFVNSLLVTVFPKLPMQSTHNRCPENICKIDLVTFLLGSVLTYKNATKAMKSLLPLSLEYMLGNVRVIDTTEKWWNAACDFLLNNKRNTTIGILRDFLKKGLEIVQGNSDCKLPDSLKLQLGRSLAKFAYGSEFSGSDNEAVLERSITFLYNVINDNRSMQSSKMVPMTMFNSHSSIVVRQNTLQNSPFNKNQNIVLFDAESVPAEVLDKWRCEACLSYIDWKLKRDNLEDESSMYDLYDLIDSAEAIDYRSPSLNLVKSRMYVAFARKSLESNDASKFNDILTKASDCVESGRQYLDTVSKADRNELDIMLNEQMDVIDGMRMSDNSLLGFTCADESSNNTDMQFNDTKFTDLSALNISEKYKHGMSNVRTESDTDYEKVQETIAVCLDKVEDADNKSQIHTYEIDTLKSQSKRHSEQYLSLITKFESLNQKLNQFAIIEDNCQQMTLENEHMKQQIHGLVSTVHDLVIKNQSLELQMDRMKRSMLIQTSVDKLSKIVESKLASTHTKVMGNLKTLDDLEVAVLNMGITDRRQISHRQKSPKKSKKVVTEKVAPKSIDLGYLTKNKWNCPTCMASNDDNMDVCACCCTANPNWARKNIEKPETVAKAPVTNNMFDLSKYTRNKWNCPTCMNSNDNHMAHCPSCETANPQVEKKGFDVPNISKISFGTKPNDQKIESNNGFDLSRLPVNTNQCPTSLNSNENHTCPSSNPSTVKKENAPKIVFGSNSKPNNAFELFSKSKTDTPQKIIFGSNSNVQNSFMFGGSTVQTTDVKVSENGFWQCKCTTRNDNDKAICVACGEGREDSDDDDDVIIISEPFVTDDQKRRARLLQLPDHFYYYENLPDNGNGDSDSDEVVDRVPIKEEQDQVNMNAIGPVEEGHGDNPEDFDAHYQPIVELAAVETVNGEEGWTSVFSDHGKLYRYVNNAWIERGLGTMKIMTMERTEGRGGRAVRLVMRRDVVHKVCCNHPVMSNCPSFSPMTNGASNATCWFANDFSDGSVATKEQFAIRFKTEQQLKAFKDKIAELQRDMVDDNDNE